MEKHQLIMHAISKICFQKTMVLLVHPSVLTNKKIRFCRQARKGVDLVTGDIRTFKLQVVWLRSIITKERLKQHMEIIHENDEDNDFLDEYFFASSYKKQIKEGIWIHIEKNHSKKGLCK